MTNLARYHAANLPDLFDKITKNSIGMDDYLNRFWEMDTTSNYPPYNLIQVNNVLSRLELALAGFKKQEVKETDGEFLHKGLAQRSFQRVWTISDDTKVGSVKFEDGLLTVELGKVVPEHHSRKEYL